ncbi:MAG: SAM-dependent methyltransferase [Rhodospirillales bacterium]
MNPLEGHLRARIARQGPLSVEQFMEDALGHPEFGYYMTRDPFGGHGDFTTAPEVSQIFGELIGAWLASVWQAMGGPSPIQLIELGPGRGTLMADALRAVCGVRGLPDAIRVALVETSPVLRRRQEQTLRESGIGSIDWYNDVSQVPAGTSLIVANEFFDALPVRQYVAHRGNWVERRIDTDPNGGGLAFVLDHKPAKPHLPPPGVSPTRDGDILESSPAGLRCMHTIAARLAEFGGAGLVIDYGHATTAVGDTLQAVRGHRYARVLDAPGEQDLTVHVDFAQLARVAMEAGATVHGPVSQAAFLSRLGIDIRLQRLLANARDDDAAAGLVAGARRLIDAKQMGELFKVMAVAGPGVGEPAGFAG